MNKNEFKEIYDNCMKAQSSNSCYPSEEGIQQMAESPSCRIMKYYRPKKEFTTFKNAWNFLRAIQKDDYQILDATGKVHYDTLDEKLE